jgi:chromosomal replication initiation ATPase DnaA
MEIVLSRDCSRVVVVVEKHFQVTAARIMGRERPPKVVNARQAAVTLRRRLYKMSSTETGDEFGQHHTNVLYAEKKVDDLCEVDRDFKRRYLAAEGELLAELEGRKQMEFGF